MDKTATDFTTLSFESAVQETLSQGAGGISTFAVLLAAFSVLFLSYLSTRNKWDIRGKDEKKEKPKGLDSIAGPKRLPLIGNLLDIKYNVEGELSIQFFRHMYFHSTLILRQDETFVYYFTHIF